MDWKSRRDFVALAAGVGLLQALPGAATLLEQETPGSTPLEAQGLRFAQMPLDFTGLSYEMPQMYNPDFFAATNTLLVEAFRGLSSHGVLRLGGNLSDVSRWSSDAGSFVTEKQTAAIEHGKTYWEWKLTDETVRAGRDGAITPAAIRNLRTFLDATNWCLLYGLNFGSGTPERAADEAACVAREIGSRLIAFQVGNESDFFGGNRYFREPGFNFDGYLSGYREFVRAVRARVPHAPFAGPDVATNMNWVDEFAERVDKPIVLLSGHYYAMGPAKDPAMNADRLLGAAPGLQRQIGAAQQASADGGGVPFRMTEGNSCFGGGKPDVSDAFASALWGAEYMLHVAAAGYAGVNLHGGGDGFYTPIETLEARMPNLRPLYFGMQFAERFAGLEIAQFSSGIPEGISAYLGKNLTRTQVALINKSAQPSSFRMGAGLPRGAWSTEWLLSAPGVDAKHGVTFAQVAPRPTSTYALAPYSAALLRWDKSDAGSPHRS